MKDTSAHLESAHRENVGEAPRALIQGSGKVPDDPEDDDDDDQEELALGATGVAEGRNVEDDEYEYEEES